jgi:hypothetical protein
MATRSAQQTEVTQVVVVWWWWPQQQQQQQQRKRQQWWMSEYVHAHHTYTPAHTCPWAAAAQGTERACQTGPAQPGYLPCTAAGKCRRAASAVCAASVYPIYIHRREARAWAANTPWANGGQYQLVTLATALEWHVAELSIVRRGHSTHHASSVEPDFAPQLFAFIRVSSAPACAWI